MPGVRPRVDQPRALWMSFCAGAMCSPVWSDCVGDQAVWVGENPELATSCSPGPGSVGWGCLGVTGEG